MTAPRLAWRLIAIVPLAVIGIFFVYPLLTMLITSLTSSGSLNLSAFAEVAGSPRLLRVFAFTAAQAALSTILTLALAIPCARVFSRYRFRGKQMLLSLAVLPFVLPAVVVAAAFLALLGERGVVNQALSQMTGSSTPILHLENTLAIVLLAHIFYNLPLALRIITSYWSNQNPRLEEAAQSLGAHGWRLWLRVWWPALRPAILSSAMLVFAFCFTSFGIVLLLGGPRFATVEVEIYRQSTGIFDLELAAALAISQIVMMFAVMWVYTGLERRSRAGQPTMRAAERPVRTRSEKAVVSAAIAVLAIILLAPLLALVMQSLQVDHGLSLQHYADLFSGDRPAVLTTAPLDAIRNSLIYASLASMLALLVGLIAAYLLTSLKPSSARWLDPALMLPLATSAVTLGLGYVLAFGRPPLDFRSSVFIIPLLHTLVALPFVIRVALPSLNAVPQTVRDSAAVLGASPARRVWRIDLPLIRRGLVVAVVFAFTISVGEFGATSFLARPESTTMPLIISRLLGQPGAGPYGQALAMAAIMLLVCAICFVIIERLQPPGVSEF